MFIKYAIFRRNHLFAPARAIKTGQRTADKRKKKQSGAAESGSAQSDFTRNDAYRTLPSPPMRAVSSSICSSGKGGRHRCRRAMLISFMGLSVCRYAVGAESSAAPAAVDNGPLAIVPHPDCHRLHDAAAVGGPVSRLYIHMEAGKAVGAVVTVLAPGVLRRAEASADLAGK